jgi:HSP20 family protein
MDLRDIIPFGNKKIDVRRDDENPFAMMQREMNRIFDSFSRNWGSGEFPEITGPFAPRMDVSEDAKAFTVRAELPGMSEKDIDLSLSGDTLTIRGEKTAEKEDKNRNYHYSERSYGSFSRSIPLPRQVDAEKVSANFRNGVLTITLPKSSAALAERKKITIQTD